MNHWIVQITSGSGPEAVRRFVALLAARIEAVCEAGGLAVDAVTTHGPIDAPRSVELAVTGPAPRVLGDECGTHALIARGREGRKENGRKRWYAGVKLVPGEPVHSAHEGTIAPKDLSITAMRAGGPGGQHVNKVASAVRVEHTPSGIAVRVCDERSQQANVRIAIARIAAALAARTARERAEGAAARRMTHWQLERGNPVRTYTITRWDEGLVPMAETRPAAGRGSA